MLEVQNYLFSEFARMDAKELFRLSKNILAGNEEGKEGLRNIVKGILDEMKKQNYEDSDMGSDYEEEVMTVGPADDTEPTPTQPSIELDMDDILDKIFSQGMDSLTREEKAFLQSQSR